MSSKSGIAFSSDYVKPAQVKIIIYTPDGLTPIYTFDSFRKVNDFVLTDWAVSMPGPGNTGSFNFTIDDSIDRAIDRDLLDDNVVVIQLGKTQASLENISYGFVENVKVQRIGPTGLKYKISGAGSGVGNNYTLVNVVKQQPPQTLETNVSIDPIVNDPRFYASNLCKEFLTSTEILSLGGLSIADRFGYSLEGIDKNIQTIISNINQPNVYASQVFNSLADGAGCFWYVDQNNVFIFSFGLNIAASGIIIKDTFEDGDDENYTSYFNDTSFEVDDSTRLEDGFQQRGIAIATKSDSSSGASAAIGSTPLWNQDLAVQTVPGPQRFQDLSFTFSRVGPGTDIDRPLDPFLNGVIVIDDGNNAPADDSVDSNVVAVFQIPILDIGASPEPTEKIDIKFLVQDIDIDKPHWIIIKERGDSLQNTILWYHDNDFDTPNRYSAIRPLPNGRGPDGSTNSPVGWVTNSKGPVYTHIFSTTSNIINEASDPASIDRWGGMGKRPKEVRIDAQWAAKDYITMNQFLGQKVTASSKKVRNFSVGHVSIPNVLFKPNTTIQIVDSQLSGFSKSKNVLARVISVDYSGDASKNDSNGIREGIFACDIKLRGFVNPLEFFNRD